jgi:hypothetical protein
MLNSHQLTLQVALTMMIIKLPITVDNIFFSIDTGRFSKEHPPRHVFPSLVWSKRNDDDMSRKGHNPPSHSCKHHTRVLYIRSYGPDILPPPSLDKCQHFWNQFHWQVYEVFEKRFLVIQSNQYFVCATQGIIEG